MLKIIVLEKSTRKPIVDILVRVESVGLSESDYTNDKGIAEFDKIIDGKYNVKIRSKDYRPYTEKMFISRNSIIYVKMIKAFD